MPIIRCNTPDKLSSPEREIHLPLLTNSPHCQPQAPPKEQDLRYRAGHITPFAAWTQCNSKVAPDTDWSNYQPSLVQQPQPSLPDDPASLREQRAMLERQRTLVLGDKAKFNDLSRQATLDDIVIAGD
ncbi:hypothetical protein FRC09_006676 [Ceratobasidium sp. 395]|nr:hypothetical protein FRC09_006676 [Ceratobasidium sp. 395]